MYYFESLAPLAYITFARDKKEKIKIKEKHMVCISTHLSTLKKRRRNFYLTCVVDYDLLLLVADSIK